jgi:RNA recognition motif-containing protein
MPETQLLEVHTLFVGNLPKHCTVAELSDIFLPFGKMSIRIKYAKVTCHPLGILIYCILLLL